MAHPWFSDGNVSSINCPHNYKKPLQPFEFMFGLDQPSTNWPGNFMPKYHVDCMTSALYDTRHGRGPKCKQFRA